MTDKRVKVMNEVISGIRVIEMYTWEYVFSNVVAAIRKFCYHVSIVIYSKVFHGSSCQCDL